MSYKLFEDRAEFQELQTTIENITRKIRSTPKEMSDWSFESQWRRVKPNLHSARDQLQILFETDKRTANLAAVQRVYEERIFRPFRGMKRIYQGVWETVSAEENWNDNIDKIKTISARYQQSTSQVTEDLLVLYPYAVLTQNRLKRCIQQFAFELDVLDGFYEQGPKRLFRAWQKLTFSDGHLYGSDVWDLARVIVSFPSLLSLLAGLMKLTDAKFLSEHHIEIVKVSCKFLADTADIEQVGWQDVQVYLRFTDTPMPVICEVALCHEMFTTARRSLGGHDAYSKFRSVKEMEKYLLRQCEVAPPPHQPCLDLGPRARLLSQRQQRGGNVLVHAWTLQNAGDTPWGEGCSLRLVSVDVRCRVGVVRDCMPGAEVTVFASVQLPVDRRVTFRLEKDGRGFGPPLEMANGGDDEKESAWSYPILPGFDDRYIDGMNQMLEMGFHDVKKNAEALKLHHGNVELAVARVVGLE